VGRGIVSVVHGELAMCAQDIVITIDGDTKEESCVGIVRMKGGPVVKVLTEIKADSDRSAGRVGGRNKCISWGVKG
jgi:hypothetical protein